ncbi:Lsr2 dimerization domain-containing protein [Microbacterium sp. 2RAF4]|uniref:Lsr2 dimerization domain-containing protein n=1 Tax=Microbacterium sp. 2RAF4 TaxID=3232999 RepID=UPI003F959BF7
MADILMKVDDLDGTPIAPGEGGSVSFGFLGRHFEIDLTDAHEVELAKLLAPYIEKAREVDLAQAHSQQLTPEQVKNLVFESLDSEQVKKLALEALDWEQGAALRAEAARLLAEGKKPYDTIAARAWLQEQGIEHNQMGPLKKEFREIYEQHFGLPGYDTAPQHPAKG